MAAMTADETDAITKQIVSVLAGEEEYDQTHEEQEYDKRCADTIHEWARSRGYVMSRNAGAARFRGDVPQLCMIIACRSLLQAREDAPPLPLPT